MRREWKRLYDAEKTEKDCPDNEGLIIRLDTKTRKLYKGDVIIDSWKPHNF